MFSAKQISAGDMPGRAPIAGYLMIPDTEAIG